MFFAPRSPIRLRVELLPVFLARALIGSEGTRAREAGFSLFILGPRSRAIVNEPRPAPFGGANFSAPTRETTCGRGG